MRIGMVGLGKMGGNMARRLMLGGHDVVGFNKTQDAINHLTADTALIPAVSPEDLARKLGSPRIVWLMLPAGAVTETSLELYAGLMSPGDILIDGGNSNFRDTMRRVNSLEGRGVHFLDVGVSGGVWGLKEGYSLMIGGDRQVSDQLRPIFETLAPAADLGWGYVGPHGAGHFTKMVHNGIEYGMMEALAEGFEILRARKEYELDLYQISKIWQHGSVVRSWLLDLTSAALADDQNLTDLEGWVADSGEGRWTVFEAIDQDVPAPVITMALLRRFESRQTERYGAKLLAAMRNQFGGHSVRRTGEER